MYVCVFILCSDGRFSFILPAICSKFGKSYVYVLSQRFGTCLILFSTQISMPLHDLGVIPKCRMLFG